MGRTTCVKSTSRSLEAIMVISTMVEAMKVTSMIVEANITNLLSKPRMKPRLMSQRSPPPPTLIVTTGQGRDAKWLSDPHLSQCITSSNDCAHKFVSSPPQNIGFRQVHDAKKHPSHFRPDSAF
mmetsp:Transcript_19745/g.35091  ORF Transcript_19745/g.35091 Transcript_19745/m.35091 type:complete len:124 (+) Transcript_19745:848-1219(+)